MLTGLVTGLERICKERHVRKSSSDFKFPMSIKQKSESSASPEPVENLVTRNLLFPEHVTLQDTRAVSEQIQLIQTAS